MHVSAFNIAAVVTLIILLPELVVESVKLCKKALNNWLARKA
jgi:hypothetical protein